MIEVGSWTSNRVRRDKKDQTGACPDYEEKQIERSIIPDGQYLLFENKGALIPIMLFHSIYC